MNASKLTGSLMVSALACLLLAGAAWSQQTTPPAPGAAPSTSPARNLHKRPDVKSGPGVTVTPMGGVPDVLKAPVVLDPPSFDFGTSNPNELIHTKFTLKNTSSRPLILNETKAACSCTQGKLSPTTIPPGGTATLDVSIDLRGSQGEVKKDVNVYFKNYPAPVVAMTTGIMCYAVTSEPAQARPNGANAGELTFSSLDGKPFKILKINGEAPKIVKIEPPGGERGIKTTVSYQLTSGSMPALFVVETDHPDAPVIDIPVWHAETSEAEMPYLQMLGDIHIMRKGLNMGVITPDKPVEINMQATVGAAYKGRPVTAYTDSPDITVEMVKVVPYRPGPGDEYTIRITSKGTREGYLLAPIYLQVEDKKARIWGGGLLKNSTTAAQGAAAPATPGSGS